MTCIIGLESDGVVHMGADSGVARGWSIESMAWPKVFIRGDFLIGSAGSLRPAQVLQYHLDVHPHHDNETDERHMLVFVDAVRDCLKEQGYATVENNTEKGGTFLVGYRGRLYHMGRDYGICRNMDGFAAIGCGQEYAMGAMAALSDLEPVERIEKSLEIAAQFSAGVCGPFVVLRGER